MATRPLGETEFEETTIERLKRLGYDYLHAQELFQRGERDSLHEVVLYGRLEAFLKKVYPAIPEHEIKRLAQILTAPDGVKLINRNMHFHQMLTKGLEFSYEVNDETYTPHVFPIDWEHPENNDFLVVNQLPIEGRMSRRPDIVIYINGLPLIVFELKNPNNEQATVYNAYNQIQNYTYDISQLFNYNAFVVISDNVETKHGMPFADYDFFASWKSIDGRNVDNNCANTMRTLIEGLFPKDRLLNYIRNFIVFLEEGSKIKSTLIEAFNEYEKSQFWSKNTRRTYRKNVICMSEYMLNQGLNPVLENIDYEFVKIWENDQRKQGYSPRTIKQHQATMQSMFTHYNQLGVINGNPFAALKITDSNKQKHHSRSLNITELYQVYKAAFELQERGVNVLVPTLIDMFSALRVTSLEKLTVRSVSTIMSGLVYEFEKDRVKEDKLLDQYLEEGDKHTDNSPNSKKRLLYSITT